MTIHACIIDAGGRAHHRGDRDLLFPYWSFTKTVMTVCALRLAEDGCVDLDADVPDTPCPEQPFTLRQLLRHTAGVPDYTADKRYHEAVAADEDAWSEERLAQVCWSHGMRYDPGRGWGYSNFGYMLARQRLEQVSGMSFARMIGAFVTEPLGLDGVILASGRADFADVHWPGARSYDPRWVYHGCLVGTAEQAAQLLHALMQGALLPPSRMAEMLEVTQLGGGIEGRPWVKIGYGMGLMIGEMGEAGRAIGHGGAGPFCVNSVFHFPDSAEPVTVASFAEGQREPETEACAVRLALEYADHSNCDRMRRNPCPDPNCC